MIHQKYIQRCLELARLGAGSVAPNPMVGCVIVHQERIIGEGHHQKYGEAHAEMNAIRAVSERSLFSDSTLYVNLEPCAHFGKTSPCADLIIRSGIKKVFIACQDPFAKVNGQGIAKLKNAAIDVNVGILEKEAVELNRRFCTFNEKKRPYIILKWAETADGLVDNERTGPYTSALKITGDTANVLVHRWRAEEAAIMVGKNTAILDDPSLTTRKYNGKSPIRILLDTNLETPLTNRLFDGSVRTFVINRKKGNSDPAVILSAEAQRRCIEGRNSKLEVEYLQLKDTHDLSEVLRILYHQNIQSIVVEGGPTLHRSFYEVGLWDEIRRFVAPMQIDQGVRSLNVELDSEEESTVGEDQLYIYRNR